MDLNNNIKVFPYHHCLLGCPGPILCFKGLRSTLGLRGVAYIPTVLGHGRALSCWTLVGHTGTCNRCSTGGHLGTSGSAHKGSTVLHDAHRAKVPLFQIQNSPSYLPPSFSTSQPTYSIHFFWLRVMLFQAALGSRFRSQHWALFSTNISSHPNVLLGNERNRGSSQIRESEGKEENHISMFQNIILPLTLQRLLHKSFLM